MFGINWYIINYGYYLDCININISVKLNLISAHYFINHIIMVFILNVYWMSWVLHFRLKNILGMSVTSVKVDTPRHGCNIVCVDTVTTYWCFIGYQYLFFKACVLLKYGALTGSFPYLCAYPYVVLSFCNVTGCD